MNKNYYPFIIAPSGYSNKEFHINYKISSRELPHMTNPNEYKLYDKLEEIFPKNVHKRLKVNFNNNSYFPDIAYIDEPKNIFIDIEIDEPYAINKKPIHYVGNEKDDLRNWIFTTGGWYVLRIAEDQILSQLDKCVKLIVDLLNQINRNLDITDYDFPELDKVKRWTKFEAEEYSKRDMRLYPGFREQKFNKQKKSIIKKFKTDYELENYIISNSEIVLEHESYRIFLIKDIKIGSIKEDQIIYLNFYFILRNPYTLEGPPDRFKYEIYSQDKTLFNKIKELKINNRFINFGTTEMEFYYGLFFYGTIDQANKFSLNWSEYLSLIP